MAHTTGKSPHSTPASADARRAPTRPATGGPRTAALGSRPAATARTGKPAAQAKAAPQAEPASRTKANPQAKPASRTKANPQAKPAPTDRFPPATAAPVRVDDGQTERADDRSDDQAGSRSNQAPPGPARRFIEPYRFDDRQRGLIDAALDDAGIDERTARSIFIGAIAYELAVFKDAITAAQLAHATALPTSQPASQPAPPASQPAPPASQPAPTTGTSTPAGAGPAIATAATERNHNGAGSAVGPAPDPDRQATATALAAVAKAATTLADQLAALDPIARERLSDRLREADPFARGYGEDYLAAVLTETRRIATASADATDLATQRTAATPVGHDPSAVAAKQHIPTLTSPPPAGRDAAPPQQQPGQQPGQQPLQQPLQQPVQRFIAHAARVYRECFDRAPGTAANDPFRRALGAIASATDTPIPTTVRVLKQALRN